MLRFLLISAFQELSIATTINYEEETCDEGTAPIHIVTASSTTQTSELVYETDFESHDEKMITVNSNLYNNRSGGWGKITAKATSNTDDDIISFRVHSPPEFFINSAYYDVEVQIIGSSHTLLVYFDTQVGGGAENEFLKDVIEAYDQEDDIDLDDAIDGYEIIGNFYQFAATSTVDCTSNMTYIFWPRIQSASTTQVETLANYTGQSAKFGLKAAGDIAISYYNGADAIQQEIPKQEINPAYVCESASWKILTSVALLGLF